MYVCIGYILHTCTQVYATFDTLHVGLDSLSRRRGGWERGGGGGVAGGGMLGGLRGGSEKVLFYVML